MKKWINLTLIGMMAVLTATQSVAKSVTNADQLTLSFSDGKESTVGIENVNRVLSSVGVRVSTIEIPGAAKPIIEVSKDRAINKQETEKLISIFSLHRGELLDQIELAGRTPEVHHGGFLSTSEVGVAPYPKVYDMKAMTPDVMHYHQEKFGKLHINSSDNGQGIDEIMTIVSGGDWTWFFTLPNDVVGKLTLGYVPIDGKAWIDLSGNIPKLID